MSLREKLAVMEILWEEISREEQSLEVPEWHQELLDEREKWLRRATLGSLIGKRPKSRSRQPLNDR
jgi:hypothetical protein